MARRRKATVDEKVDQPQMTPFIDVTFQLLIFFMLTIKFKEIEGRLLSHLPTDQGLVSSPSTKPPEEVRVILCLDGDAENHEANKGYHDTREHFPNPTYTTAPVHIFVDKNNVGQALLANDGTLPDEMVGLYRRAAQLAVESRNLKPPDDQGRPAPIKIDADSGVPFHHVLTLIDQLQALGARENVLFAGNPRLDRYFGK